MEGSEDDKKPSPSRRITIEGMRLLVEGKKKAMLFETESMNKNGDDVKNSRKGHQKEDGEAGGSVIVEEEDSGKEKDQDGEGSSGKEEEMEDS